MEYFALSYHFTDTLPFDIQKGWALLLITPYDSKTQKQEYSNYGDLPIRTVLMGEKIITGCGYMSRIGYGVYSREGNLEEIAKKTCRELEGRDFRSVLDFFTMRLNPEKAGLFHQKNDKLTK